MNDTRDSLLDEIGRELNIDASPAFRARVRAAKAALLDFQDVAERQPGAPEPLAEEGLTLASWGLPMDGLLQVRGTG